MPAGGALAVGREAFAERVTERIAGHPRIRVVREQVHAVPPAGLTVVATGPLTSAELASDIARFGGGGAALLL